VFDWLLADAAVLPLEQDAVASVNRNAVISVRYSNPLFTMPSPVIPFPSSNVC
jgi:hypothetical protein